MGPAHYLIDTNAVIDYLGGRFPDKGQVFMDNVINNGPQISFITQIELLCFKNTAKHQSVLKQFVNDALVHSIQSPITELTISIRRNSAIKIPDAIIAATAIHNKLILITRNVKDFEKISKLTVIDPHAL